jgi:hypothetical protein
MEGRFLGRRDVLIIVLVAGVILLAVAVIHGGIYSQVRTDESRVVRLNRITGGMISCAGTTCRPMQVQEPKPKYTVEYFDSLDSSDVDKRKK